MQETGSYIKRFPTPYSPSSAYPGRQLSQGPLLRINFNGDTRSKSRQTAIGTVIELNISRAAQLFNVVSMAHYSQPLSLTND